MPANNINSMIMHPSTNTPPGNPSMAYINSSSFMRPAGSFANYQTGSYGFNQGTFVRPSGSGAECATNKRGMRQIPLESPKEWLDGSVILNFGPSRHPYLLCKACGKNVTGFYYFCAKCGDHYHILCSVVPLSVTIPSHPHALNLEFSPPYDFECDLCSGPGFSGWLYRCGFCDFDVHLACAFSNRRAHSFRFQPVPLAGLLARPSPTRMENNPFVDYSSKDNELLMQLMAIGFAGGKGESDGHDISQTVEGGRDDCEAKVRSGGNRGASELCQTKPDMADAHSRPRKLSEPSTPHSEDLTMSSFQFSDAYFSIDLAKTCPGDDLLNLQASPVPDNKETKSSGYIILPNRLPGFDPRSRGTENRQNEAISTGLDALIGKELGQESKRQKANGFREGSDIKDKSAESDMAGLGYCSRLSKLFFCC
ncbi:hypothetical protein L1049_008072 [Liquidambar formosana]|uniref:Zinc finger PHD-type domain-containing protein n=1 Tax=Liquidambar formosana TaxID=63359 RepID=A0AAP0S2G8_LIQFO